MDSVDGAARGDADIYAGEGAETACRSLDGSERGQRRNLGAVRAALDGVLKTVTPSLPLTLADAAALFDMMRAHAPAPLILDVMHDHREIFVRVYEGKAKIYERRLGPG